MSNLKILIMKKLIIGLLIIGLTTQVYAQVVDEGTLPEIEVRAMNYKYLNSVDNSAAAFDIRKLEQKVANFDLKSSEFYEENFDFYKLYFYIPDGNILASYDNKGKILSTIEKFKDVKPPRAVINSVAKRFPGWTVANDMYKVTYHYKKGTVKTYKLMLENGDRHMRVKTDENGKFL